MAKDVVTARPAQRRQGRGVALMLLSAASNQSGAGFGALAFPVMGPVGVIVVRQFVTALVLIPTVRPDIRALTARQWWPIGCLALVFSVMNLSLYAAVARIGLGTAVTLEFLGPLAVAICASARRIDMAAAIIAAVGVVVLTHPGFDSDPVGVLLALVAAACWASYILLNRAVGQRITGLQGTAVASLVAIALWVPVAIVWFDQYTPTVAALLYATVCGLLSSVVPYVTDLLALRLVRPHVFGTFASANPVFAAIAGIVLLGQVLTVGEWIGIGFIVTSNVIVTSSSHP
jgi:inner membrane transporter RhtA